jgi:hypothetical protein
MKREHSIGARVSDTSADTAIDAVTVSTEEYLQMKILNYIDQRNHAVLLTLHTTFGSQWPKSEQKTLISLIHFLF